MSVHRFAIRVWLTIISTKWEDKILQPRSLLRARPIESFPVSSGSVFGLHRGGLFKKHVAITRSHHQTRSNKRGRFISC